MTTIEKLERLVKEKGASVGRTSIGGFLVTPYGKSFYGTLTEAIDKAYEAAFPTRKLEPGDLFTIGAALYIADARGSVRFWDNGVWKSSEWTLSALAPYGYTIIGKALDEPVEVRS